MDDGQPVGVVVEKKRNTYTGGRKASRQKSGQVNEAIMEIGNPTYTPNVSGLGSLHISLFRDQNRKAGRIVLTRIDISIRKLSAPVKMDATDTDIAPTSWHILPQTHIIYSKYMYLYTI